jgi:hypothetical protein
MLIPALSKGPASPALPKMLINSPGSGAGASDGFTSSLALSEVDADASSPCAFIANVTIITTARLNANSCFFTLHPPEWIIFSGQSERRLKPNLLLYLSKALNQFPCQSTIDSLSCQNLVAIEMLR